jgi:spore coat polysaccharide biosynthesis protein SpsF
MTSTRLPGKILRTLAGRPMLSHQLRRLKSCRELDEIVVATTANAADDAVASLADGEGVRWFRGDERDVLSRYVGAAREAGAEVVVRVTADCPLIDAGIVDRVVQELSGRPGGCDYASDIVRRTYPRGLDVEALFSDVLYRADRLGASPAAREHVTYFIWKERPDLFVIRSVEDGEDNSDLRWTVDTEADFAMVRAVYEGLRLGETPASYREVLAYVRAHPEISSLNAAVAQKPETAA